MEQLTKYDLSNDGSQVISHRLQIDTVIHKDADELRAYYSLDRIVEFISSRGYNKVTFVVGRCKSKGRCITIFSNTIAVIQLVN